MTLEQQVVSLDLAKRLKELGVKQESYFYWELLETADAVYKPKLIDEHSADDRPFPGKQDRIAAFTVAELGEKLRYPKKGDYITTNFDPESLQWICQIRYWESLKKIGTTVVANTEANARAKMLVYLLENKSITL